MISILFLIIRRIWLYLFFMGLIALMGVAGGLYYLGRDLPQVAKLEEPDYSLPTKIFDRHGQLVDEIFTQRRKLVTYEQLPPYLIQGLVAKEDSRFFEHYGIDPLRMFKAFWVNLLAGRIVQGASTITQQTARLFFLTPEKRYVRKIKEILLALRIEGEFTKKEILTLYMNKANFGDAYGVSAAAEVYFDKRVENLTLAQSATLVALLPSPNEYKPTRNPVKARQQRNIVLARMAQEGYITPELQKAAASESMMISDRSNPKLDATASFVELVRRTIQEKFGSKRLYEGGLRVHTAMDLSYQIFAHKELQAGVRAVDRRRGFRGPVGQVELDDQGNISEEDLLELNPGRVLEVGKIVFGVVKEVEPLRARVAVSPDQDGEILWEFIKENWPSYLVKPEDPESERLPIHGLDDILKPGDQIQVEIVGHDPISNAMRFDLYQEPEANGAIFAMNPHTGEVLAMVGGIRYGRKEGGSEFIRATQAERQPGSSFKPIIYAAAIEEGYTPASVLDDSPRVFTLETGKKHIPKNYDNTYLGRLSLRDSLVRSRNVPTVQLVDQMGALTVIKYARKFGITTDIPTESIIALGTHSVKLSELTRAYAVFPNGGRRVDPIYILRIEDSKGNVLLENHSINEQVISESSAYILADMLQDVVRSPFGTGYRAMQGINRPAAGKTGTTQNYTDAWYLGFIPQLVAGVYVGFDDPTISLGYSETGARAAAPIWKGFIDRVKDSLPIETFRRPETVVTMRVGPKGELLDPCDDPTQAHYELFKQEWIPRRFQLGKSCGRAPVERLPAGSQTGENGSEREEL